MIDARKNDGRFGPSQFVPNANPGFFDPVAPNGTTVLDPLRGSAASSRS